MTPFISILESSADALRLQVALLVGVLATAFAGPTIRRCGFSFAGKRVARSKRRSPIGLDLLRGPGHSLQEQIEEATGELVVDLILLTIIPLLLLCFSLGQGMVGGLQQMLRTAPIYIVLAIGFFAYMVRKLLKAGHHLDRLKAGYDAELAVGQELDQLMASGRGGLP